MSALKSGTKVSYTYAAGKVVPGTVVKRHRDMLDGNWYVLKLTDEAGTYRGSCHRDQIAVTDNRPGRQ